MRKRIRFVIKAGVFLLLFGFLWQRVSWAVSCGGMGEGDPDRRASLFFALPRNSVDCIFAGTSHIYCSYIPKQIYDSAGITSASIATSAQSFQNTYWLLKEALQRQNPKVVVLDLSALPYAVNENVKNFRLHYTSGISILPDLSVNKILLYREIKKYEEGWSHQMTIFDASALLEYRNERDRDGNPLEWLDILFAPAQSYKTFGFMPTTTVSPQENIVPCKVTDHMIDLEETLEFQYLKKMKELLEAHDANLIVCRAPYQGSEFDDFHLYNQAEQWLKEEQIPYIDYFAHMDEMGINLETDFRDADHLNFLGAEKLTNYFITYLQEHFYFENHKGDKRYRLWGDNHLDYEKYREEILSALQQKSND